MDALGEVWVGIATHADLVVLDPETGEHHSMLPEQYRHNFMCYSLRPPSREPPNRLPLVRDRAGQVYIRATMRT